jgi:hypothetical protein
MFTTCVGCSGRLVSNGRRGPKKSKCRTCKAADEVARRKRNRLKYSTRHGHKCHHCGLKFQSERKRQKYCSAQCRALGRRRRLVAACANERCGKEFETRPGRLANGHRFCCRECSYHEPLICKNPACGKQFRMKHATKNKWQNAGKYCCRDCYNDHRWGENRPRKEWPRSHVQAASRRALATSLRKKCKILGVPNDPECTRQAVCERDNWVCQMCGIDCLKDWTFNKQTRQIDPRSAEHDHIVHLTAKGSPGNVFPNSQCLCHACNNRKRDSAWGQLRLDFEGSVQRWVEGGFARNQRRSRSSVAILAAGV